MAIASTIVTLVFLIAFAVILVQVSLMICVPAIIAAVVGSLVLPLIVLLVFQNGEGMKCVSQRWWPWPRRVELASIMCGLWMMVTVVTLAWMQIRFTNLPERMLGASRHSILAAAFAVWAVAVLMQSLYLTLMAYGTRWAEQQAPSCPTEERSRSIARMQKTSFPRTPQSRDRGVTVSLRNSLTQVVRPVSSKTRLLSLKISNRSASMDSGTGERQSPAEDGFDSWDTSAVRMQQTWVISSTSSPIPGPCLETIPASPIGSRSSSPDCTLDPHPPSSVWSNSQPPSGTPVTSCREVEKLGIATSPAGSEAHIHPLFRTDTPEPPPATTPGTVVTAAPGAGQLISDPRDLSKMRSGSLPTSSDPLPHTKSLDDMRRQSGSDDSGKLSPPGREMTPPIPDWILGAGFRTSLNGYSCRKGGPGLRAVGELTEG
ncbi:MAG: hypothetical protein M1818_000131 [Claussenomyces sp. TS43310]|nr:MAG: hypothetical protein M1818_000131 [Claussenomyces sp. TS43310]